MVAMLDSSAVEPPRRSAMEVPLRDPSGYGHRLGAPKKRFAGSVALGSSSALGDALVGRRKWTDPEVIRERDVLLGSDSAAALVYVQGVRARLVEQYKAAFSSMVQTEREQFAEQSYFAARGQEEAGEEEGEAEESDSSAVSLDSESEDEEGMGRSQSSEQNI
ncbi:MAG: hypothetical protein M1839_009041 [Geoglossum umbratile]|nr:MAG: hypothetical protein M1839_009041 [Geoglossum umbratile]